MPVLAPRYRGRSHFFAVLIRKLTCMQTTTMGEPPKVSLFNALIAMFHQPTRAFAMLEQRPASGFPLLLLMISQLIIALWYFQMVDSEFLAQSMAQSAQGAAAPIGKGAFRMFALASALLGLPLLAAMRGVYFMIVDKIFHTGVGFGKGIALSLWAWIPALLLLPLAAAQILLHPSGELTLSALNPLSLNQLFFLLPTPNKWAALLDSVSVLLVWEMLLMVAGFRVWAKAPRVKAACIALFPYFLIYGFWLAYLVSKNA